MNDRGDLVRRVHLDMLDSFDEELELELEDMAIDATTGEPIGGQGAQDKADRARDFKELFRLQAELVKLQEEFFLSVPEVEKMLVRSGIQLIKYWFSVTDEEQRFRFLGRIHDPMKQWKLSPMDVEARRRWEEYTKAKEVMLERTHIPEAKSSSRRSIDGTRASAGPMTAKPTTNAQSREFSRGPCSTAGRVSDLPGLVERGLDGLDR